MAISTGKSVDTGPSSCKVLIIGAGMAGLSAANHLMKNAEPDFLIVEACSRIGGRIISADIGDKKVELGANWIHGVLGNPIFELAMANDLISIMSIPRPHKIVAALENGKQIPFSILEEIYAAYVCFLKRCEEYFLSSYSPPDGISSVGEHISLEAKMYLDNFSPEDRKIRQLIFDCLMKRETCITGCDSMKDIDLLEMGSYTELQGGNISLPGGYSSILGPVSKHIPKEKILTCQPVSKIRWQTDQKGSPTSKQCIEVQCETGKVINCEQVICTLPLGVLKECASSIFEPQLPERKLQAINRLMFGTVDKIILEYERPFLNPGISEIMLLWDEDSTHDSADLADTWHRKIYSFTKLSDTLVLGWVSGKEAEYMETLDSAEISRVCTNILRRFLNDPYIPAPKSCLCTKWRQQPYTRGSYTAMAVGASQLDIECLAEPLDSTKLRVAFAGEHTHSSFYSTVHGAYLSGRTAAQSVLESRRWEKQTSLSCDNTNDLSSWIQGIQLN
ncbi:hypothetical protein QAD02_019469 [Eretmocerus hayati]|uniref:Uncharacterized protein n=1 Tax=Eretmocerus hayati TaxID=131215 RepID=A0ACC2PJZ2_9HYME|nr:hypothetical protein QAD02_019469 [Eretmocerus hayati]